MFKVILNDPEDKLYSIGYGDGHARVTRILERHPRDLESILEDLEPIGPERYLKGYYDGAKAASIEFKEIDKENEKIK